jgi:kynurenine formamidase
MKTIDLTQPLYHHMPVYPGDPEVLVEEIHQLDREGWNLRQLQLTTHLGTHVNVPYHMVVGGKTLDDFEIGVFMGKAKIYREGIEYNEQLGLIFRDQNIDRKLAQLLIDKKPKFIGLAEKFEFDLDLEKLLLEHDIISYENLANTEALPTNKAFEFQGLPLRIRGGDGSPVRAVAKIDIPY